MSGNVSEWVWDTWDEKAYESRAKIDPIIEKKSKRRVVRGGSWNRSQEWARSSARASRDASDKSNNRGFRLLRILSP